jgi:hypothetical protein
MCTWWSARIGCDEEQVEDVSDTERANFCDYFKLLTSNAASVDIQKSQGAKAQLAEHFGDPVEQEQVSDPQLSAQQLAEKKLRDMLQNI